MRLVIERRMKIGFVVNPVAGMGGKVGLKGTDNVLKEAIKRGAKPVSPKRAGKFLKTLKDRAALDHLEIWTCPKAMGEDEAKQAKVAVNILPMRIQEKTTAEDTKIAVKLLKEAKVDLIVFVGGDGTAKDIYDALQGSSAVPVLGVPAGVKMYSGVFAISPSDAVDIVHAFVKGEAETAALEIMDADEDAIRSDTFSIELYGYLETPFLPMRIQGSKQISSATVEERDSQLAIARFIIEEMHPEDTYILGPGTTVKAIAELLGVEKTLLGVDIYRKGKVVLDVNEKKILNRIQDWKRTWIILSPIGRQGILLGRGNQQISPEIVKRVGKDRIIVAATRNKLQSIEGNVFRVDTGDAEADGLLKGYLRVVTDYREWRLVEVK
ncbi:MAG: ATP-NAD kinase family protein [Candidatus Bathyarchaeota archaeon]|nr:ATP-NAD kinase family protein [Candidatus Bathyarchaeota archaeon]